MPFCDLTWRLHLQQSLEKGVAAVRQGEGIKGHELRVGLNDLRPAVEETH